MKKLLFIISILVLAACSPGNLVGTGYHTVIESGRMVWQDKLHTTAETDSFIVAKTDLPLCTDSLIGANPPAFRFENFEFDVYVEEKAIYQRRENGRERWRRIR